MKRTKRPHLMKTIQKKDVMISILEDKGQFELRAEINLSRYGFDTESKVFLDVHDSRNLYRIDFGNTGAFNEEKSMHEMLPTLEVPKRRKMRFRLKVVDPKTSRLLGSIENIREFGYAESLLPMELSDRITGIFKIEWDTDTPTLLINKRLEDCLKSMAPIIAESAFREIAMTFFQNSDDFDDDSLEEHEWGKCLKSYSDISLKDLRDTPWTERIAKIGDMAQRFSSKMKNVDKILVSNKVKSR